MLVPRADPAQLHRISPYHDAMVSFIEIGAHRSFALADRDVTDDAVKIACGSAQRYVPTPCRLGY